MAHRFIQGLDSLPSAARQCVLTVGNFDGVHLGHQRIVHAARTIADGCGMPAVAMTFDPPPDLVLSPGDDPQRVTVLADKTRLLLEAGADLVVAAETTAELLSMAADEFIAEIITARLSPVHIVEGHDFFFGRKRLGNVETLQAASQAGGFEVHVVDPVEIDLPEGKSRVSSTLIRSLIMAGRVDQASRCLGRDYLLRGKVVSGTGQGGKLLGFPTINLETGEQVVPGDGIYAGRATVGLADCVAAISIGDNPTFGGRRRSVEAFLLDTEGQFTGQDAALCFVRRIREQRKFESHEALKAKIAEDVKRVREVIG